MNVLRYLNGVLSARYSKHNKWFYFGISKYWAGRLVYIEIGRITVVLDCRIDWMEDMKTGRIK